MVTNVNNSNSVKAKAIKRGRSLIYARMVSHLFKTNREKPIKLDKENYAECIFIIQFPRRTVATLLSSIIALERKNRFGSHTSPRERSTSKVVYCQFFFRNP